MSWCLGSGRPPPGWTVWYSTQRTPTSDAGRPVTIASAPSLARQAMTTRQPEDDQIEVAIAAMEQAIAGDAALVEQGEGQE